MGSDDTYEGWLRGRMASRAGKRPIKRGDRLAIVYTWEDPPRVSGHTIAHDDEMPHGSVWVQAMGPICGLDVKDLQRFDESKHGPWKLGHHPRTAHHDSE